MSKLIFSSLTLLASAGVILGFTYTVPDEYIPITQEQRRFCEVCVSGPMAIVVLPGKFLHDHSFLCTSFPPRNGTWTAYHYALHLIDCRFPRQYNTTNIYHHKPGELWVNEFHYNETGLPQIVDHALHQALRVTLPKLWDTIKFLGGYTFNTTLDHTLMHMFH